MQGLQQYKSGVLRYYSNSFIKLLRYFILLFIILLTPYDLFSQSGYYSTDSTTFYGANVLAGNDRQNARICRVEREGEILEFTPDEISEYGFDDGRVFVSRTIQGEEANYKVFLERITNGNVTLYYFKGKKVKTYFLEKDSTLFVELPKKDDEKSYKDKLIAITGDCSSVSEAGKFVKYKKRSLSKFIQRYNACELKPFPHFRFGAIVGYEYAKILLSNGAIDNFQYFDYDYDRGLAFGIFMEQPIFVSDFSLYVELNYVKHGYSYNRLLDSKDLDFVANLSSLKFPLMLRYRVPTNKVRPYANLGFIGTYNLDNTYTLYDSRILENTIELGEELGDAFYDSFQLGYCLGAGVEFKIYSKYSLFIEFRYFKQNWLIHPKRTGNQNFGIFTGINF